MVFVKGNIMETKEILKEGEVKHRSKLNGTTYSLITTHGCNEIVSIFVSTFLISYIYSISNNYLLNIGLFYMFSYIAMFIFYYLVSRIIDRTNRIVLYRVAIFIRAIFILMVVFLGKKLAGVVYLAGFLNGISEGFYWCSFNLMKNELVPNHCIRQYSLTQTIVGKVVGFVVPIILGKIIDAESFKLTAIIVLAIAVVEMTFSIFIKSRRPENSGFDLKSFIKHAKSSEQNRALFKIVFLCSFCYGFLSMVAPLNTMLVMITFNSNFTLGLLTGIFSGLSIILLFIIKKFAVNSRNKWYYLFAAFMPITSGIVLAFFTNEIVLIIFNFIFYLGQVVHTYFYDVYRNTLLKKLDLYGDIAEYQFMIEGLMEIARIIGFGLMAFAGVIVGWIGMSSLVLVVKIFFVLSLLSYMLMNLGTWAMERKFVKYNMIVK